MMKKILAAWHTLTDKEKLEVTALLLFIAFATAFISLGISWSRGHDVDYFKERIITMEQQIISMDKKLHDANLKLDKVNESVIQNRNILDQEIRRSDNQDLWLEEWKKLPTLPKPKTR